MIGALGLAAPRAGAEGPASSPPLVATMQCERVAEPGRVKCSIEAKLPPVDAGGGGAATTRSIAWADVALIELPDFTAALKGRIGSADATARDANRQTWAFGLVARKAGEGEAKARVRAVVCEASTSPNARAPRCTPVTVDVKALVHVG